MNSDKANLTSDSVGGDLPPARSKHIRRFRFRSETLRAMFSEDEPNLIAVLNALTTTGRFDRFDESLCHLCDDGVIRRYGREIGTEADIEWLEDAA